MPAEGSQIADHLIPPPAEEGFILQAVILANGVLEHPQAALSILETGDLTIAADGGAHHFRQLGLTPDVIIGDFDSLTTDELESFQEAGAETVRYPARKDFTDLELAIRYAVEYGAEDIVILAALGARWDQTLANVLLPASLSLSDVRIRILDGPQEILVLRAGQKMEIPGTSGDTLSLVPLSEQAYGITTQGLEYSLDKGTLRRGDTRGISNVITNKAAQVSLDEGLLLIVVIHQTFS